MLDVLASGYLVKTPKLLTGRSGNEYCTFLMAAHQHGEEDSVLVSGLAFGDVGVQLSQLKARDPLSVIGTLKLAEWLGKDGVTRTGLNVVATGLLTPYAIKKRRGSNSTPKQNLSQRDYSGGYNDDFDDEIPI